MAKKKRQLTQAEIWDDSALQQSWDAALEEYKLYHSIHARGERVEDVIRDTEGNDEDEEMVTNGLEGDRSVVAEQTDNTDSDDLEEGEVEDQTSHKIAQAEADTSNLVDAALLDHSAQPHPQTNTDTEGRPQGTSGMPNSILTTVHDEALKNLMMSWYYAGYYTGLYEGQQKAAQSQLPTKTG